MNPTTGIAPQMDTNEAIRRLLYIQQDETGLPKPGAPGGPVPGTDIKPTRVAAADPAVLLVAARKDRQGMLLRNLDDTLIAYYGTSPDINEVTGATLNASESIPVNVRSAIYIFAPSGNPMIEATEVYGV